MGHTIKIRDEVYSMLTDQAAEAGVTPDAWVEMKVKETAPKTKKKVSKKTQIKTWENFIGAAERIPDVKRRKDKNPEFGEILTAKLKKMGLRADYDAD